MAIALIQQISAHLRRAARARRFGVAFARRSRFAVPSCVSLGPRTVALSYPDELGVRNDFLACIIEDHYGLDAFPSPARTILDIGANVGFFSLAARARFSEAIIHAYEPNPRILTCLRYNAEAGDFVMYPEAIGSERGWVRISDGGDSNQARTVAGDSSDNRDIPQIPLREAIARLGGSVDLAKVDCEGAEWNLFQDTESWTNVRYLRMEYHLWNTHTFGELTRVLQGLGFSITKHEPSGEFGLVWCTNQIGR